MLTGSPTWKKVVKGALRFGATHGEFPISFGPVAYAQKQAEATAAATKAQDDRLRLLEVLNEIRDPADLEVR